MRFLFLIFIPSIAIATPCAHTETTFACVKFVSNHDGDTIRVDIPGVPAYFAHMPVRVLGVDTAEMSGHKPCEHDMALLAQSFVYSQLTKAARIDLLVDPARHEKYSRILARVIYDGKDLSVELLKRGLAVQYFGKTKVTKTWCK